MMRRRLRLSQEVSKRRLPENPIERAGGVGEDRSQGRWIADAIRVGHENRRPHTFTGPPGSRIAFAITNII
jgi:hypothetical protein